MDLTKKSIEVLKSLQLKNGGITATPFRKGAYPYVYIRDGVIISKALNRAGYVKNSERFYYFIKKYGKTNELGELMHRYTPAGLPASTRRHQHDNVSLAVHGIYDTYSHSKNREFLIDMWPLVKSLVSSIDGFQKNGLIKTESSIHESNELEEGFEIWANCAACRAFLDASEISKELNCNSEFKRWKKSGNQLRKNILEKMTDKKTGIFYKNLRFKKVSDISQLAPFYFDIVASKLQLKNTLQNLKENLWINDFKGFRRFKKQQIVKDWHWYTGGSGAWIAFNLWGARFYRKIGDKENENECLQLVHKIAERTNGLLPEHVSTKEEYDLWKDNEIEFNDRIFNGMKETEKLNKILKRKFGEDIVYWALPLGWSHAEYLIYQLEKPKSY